MLLPGDPAPVFAVESSVNPDFHVDTAAGRYVVMCFFASTKLPFAARLLEEVNRRRERFDVTNLIFFGVSVDPEDRNRLAQQWPGLIYFWDSNLAVSRKYGVVQGDAPGVAGQGSQRDAGGEAAGGRHSYRAQTVVLDPALRVLAVVDFGGDPVDHLESILQFIDTLPKLDAAAPAPVLMVPHVFEPELCRQLIDYYEARGGRESGFMRDVGGKTVELMDYGHKRRRDCEIKDDNLIRATHQRLLRRVIPAIRQAFQFNATRIERTMVARYDSDEGGHFKAHRDNTTMGTAHRRFAVTLNLNSGEFEGGELWFPEFSRRTYKAPTGGAVVFSCSLLHEAKPVTKGRRYAFLPFLYDDAAARIRESNQHYLANTRPRDPGSSTEAAPESPPTPPSESSSVK